MIFLAAFFILFSTIVSLGLYFSVKKNLELIDELEKTVEQFEAITERLDFYNKRIEKKSKLEVFSDDQIVRELVEDMRQIRNLISSVSGSLYEHENNIEAEQRRK